MRKLTRLLLLPVILIPLIAASCGNAPTKTKLISATANATAGLDAWAKALDVARKYGDIAEDDYKSQIRLIEDLRGDVDQIAAKIDAGFSSKDLLGKFNEIADEIVKAEKGLRIKNPESQARFRAVFGFVKFGILTAQNIIKKLPPPDNPDKVASQSEAAAAGAARIRRASAQGATESLAKLQDYINVGYEFGSRAFDHIPNETNYDAIKASQSAISAALGLANADRLK